MPTRATTTPSPVSASTKRRLPADENNRTRPTSQMTRAAYNTSATRVLAGQIDKACASPAPAANAGSSSRRMLAARGLRAVSSGAGNGTSWTAIATPTAQSAHTSDRLIVEDEGPAATLHAAEATSAAASDQ